MSKGSARRPAQVSEAEVARRWTETFGGGGDSAPHRHHPAPAKLRAWKRRRRAQLRNLLDTLRIERGNACQHCGTSSAPLEWHHRNPADKIAKLGKMTRQYSDARVREEADKCDLVCRQCHAAAHVALRADVA